MALRLELSSFHYPGGPELFAPFTVELAAGETVALVGASGSGKSSLLTLLAGLHPEPLGGRFQGVLRGDDGSGPGYLGSDPETFLTGFCATVLEEVGWTLFGWGWEPDRVEERVLATLRDLRLEDLTRRDPGRLSGGQQQMVALACVWARQPRYLLLDEPASKLDPHAREHLMSTVSRLARQAQVGVLWSTANLGEVRWCDTVWSLDGGTLRKTPAADWVPGDEGAVPPWPRRWARLWEQDPPPWTSLTLDRAGPVPELIPAVGQELAVEVRGLRYRPPGAERDLFESLDWQVARGECVGLVGVNGSGKTTLARLLRGLLSADAGSIKVAEQEVARQPASELASAIGYTFQDPGNLFLKTRVDAELRLSGELLGLSRERAMERCEKALRHFGLTDHAATHPRELSATDAALLGVALAWYSDAPVQILDEPLARLDQAGRERLEKVLGSWRDRGVTVILIAHDLDWLATVCHTVAVLDAGCVMVHGPTTRVFADPRVVKLLGAPLPLLSQT